MSLSLLTRKTFYLPSPCFCHPRGGHEKVAWMGPLLSSFPKWEHTVGRGTAHSQDFYYQTDFTPSLLWFTGWQQGIQLVWFSLDICPYHVKVRRVTWDRPYSYHSDSYLKEHHSLIPFTKNVLFLSNLQSVVLTTQLMRLVPTPQSGASYVWMVFLSSFTRKSWRDEIHNPHRSYPLSCYGRGGSEVLFSFCPFQIAIHIYLPISIPSKTYYMLTSIIIRCPVFQE